MRRQLEEAEYEQRRAWEQYNEVDPRNRLVAAELLRPFLRNDRTLFSDIGRLIFDILSSYFSQAAGRPLQGAMLSRPADSKSLSS